MPARDQRDGSIQAPAGENLTGGLIEPIPERRHHLSVGLQHMAALGWERCQETVTRLVM
jgi:hypothetical protein